MKLTNEIKVILISLIIAVVAIAEPITGRIIDSQTRETIPGAHIKLLGGQAGDVTNIQGQFTLETGDVELPQTIVISHISYDPDTVVITFSKGNEIALRPAAIMGGEVVVQEYASGSGRGVDGDVVGSADIIERRDAGAGSLGDLLQGMVGASVQVCCALDSRAELRLLGLPGGYTEITLDGIPEVGGLAGNYRLYSYPAIGITRMEVKKGASSAYSKAKALGGHLDIQTRKPSGEIPEGSIAAYYRAVGGNQLQGELATAIGGIGVATAFDMASGDAFDRDGDGWSESPKNERSFGRVRLMLGESPSYNASVTGLFIRENRLGGMIGFDRESFGDGEHWIRSVITQRYEGSFSYGMPFVDGNLSLTGTLADVDLDQIAGERQTIVNENGYALQTNWSRNLFATNFSIGAEYHAETIEDSSPGFEGRLDSKDDRISFIAEDEFYPAYPVTMKFGLRLDGDSKANSSKVWNLFPRLSLQWNFTDDFMMLASYGSGGRFRPSVQDLMEGYDQSVSVIVPANLENERGYAATIGSEWKKFFGTDILTIAGGGSYSRISRRIVPVPDGEGGLTYINAEGPTSVTSMHLQGSMDWARGITLQAGTEFTQSQTTVGGVTSSLPFTPEWRGFGKLVWKDIAGVDGLKVWLNSTLFGPQDLPENTFAIDRSDAFSIHDIAATFRTGPISFTFGVWNIFDEVQSISPLQGTADPFASGVSTELVYGPLVGRNYMASIVYHFGLATDVLMGAGYGGLVEKSGETYVDAEHSEDDGHGHGSAPVRQRPATTGGHVHGPDCDHGGVEDSHTRNQSVREGPEIPATTLNAHVHGPDCDHGLNETASSVREGSSSPEIHAHGEDCDHGHAEQTSIKQNEITEANVWLIDGEGKHFICPSTGNSGIVDAKTPFTLLNDKKYYHCCPSCKGEEKVKNALKSGFVVPGNVIEKEGDELRFVCPIMGNESVVSSTTTYSDFDGRRYFFCCPPCKDDFDAAPERYSN